MPVLTAPDVLRAAFFERHSDAVLRVLHAHGGVVLQPPRFEDLPVESGSIAPDRIGFYSSGSTGAPKIHAVRRDGLAWNARVSASAFDLGPDDRVLILASPWHIAGFTWYAAAAAAGARVEIQIPHVARAHEFAALVADRRPTKLFAVPSVLNALLNAGMPFVPHIITGGAAVPVDDLHRLKSCCAVFTQAWGQSEAGGLLASATFPATDLNASVFRNVGLPPDGISLACAGLPEAPAPVFASSPSAVADGLYDTGDTGWFSGGRLILFGRKDQRQTCNALTGISLVLHK